MSRFLHRAAVALAAVALSATVTSPASAARQPITYTQAWTVTMCQGDQLMFSVPSTLDGVHNFAVKVAGVTVAASPPTQAGLPPVPVIGSQELTPNLDLSPKDYDTFDVIGDGPIASRKGILKVLSLTDCAVAA
jgi:hypothetical protein